MKTLGQEEGDSSAYRDVVDARGRIGAFIDPQPPAAPLDTRLPGARGVRRNIVELEGGDLATFKLNRPKLSLIPVSQPKGAVQSQVSRGARKWILLTLSALKEK
jgi:hypothetical protein